MCYQLSQCDIYVLVYSECDISYVLIFQSNWDVSWFEVLAMFWYSPMKECHDIQWMWLFWTFLFRLTYLISNLYYQIYSGIQCALDSPRLRTNTEGNDPERKLMKIVDEEFYLGESVNDPWLTGNGKKNSAKTWPDALTAPMHRCISGALNYPGQEVQSNKPDGACKFQAKRRKYGGVVDWDDEK